MISTTNYVARKYGVRAAMPGFIGKKLCPQLIFVKSHFEKYTLVAEQIRAIIRQYDPDFTSHSLDEVYMDLTDAATLYVQNQRMNEVEMGMGMGTEMDRIDVSSSTASSSSFRSSHTLHPAPSITSISPSLLTSSSSSSSSSAKQIEFNAVDDEYSTNKIEKLITSKKPLNSSTTTSTHTLPLPLPLPPPLTSNLPISQLLLRKAACIILEDIRHQIQKVTGGLTCSAGIANNFFLAKICADTNKPNGQFELPGNRHGMRFSFYLYFVFCIV